MANGNVGIGTTNPLNKLHVAGTGAGAAGIYLNDAAPGTNTATLYNSGGNLYWAGTNLSGGMLPSGTFDGQTLRYTGAAWAANGNLFNNGTNVGIGTTNPLSKLQVHADTNQNFHITSDSGELQIAAMNDAVNSTVQMRFAASEYNFEYGNVGIGTTNPLNKLTVNGNANFTGHLAIGNNAVIDNGADTICPPPSRSTKTLPRIFPQGTIGKASHSIRTITTPEQAKAIFILWIYQLKLLRVRPVRSADAEAALYMDGELWLGKCWLHYMEQI